MRLAASMSRSLGIQRARGYLQAQGTGAYANNVANLKTSLSVLVRLSHKPCNQVAISRFPETLHACSVSRRNTHIHSLLRGLRYCNMQPATDSYIVRNEAHHIQMHQQLVDAHSRSSLPLPIVVDLILMLSKAQMRTPAYSRV